MIFKLNKFNNRKADVQEGRALAAWYPKLHSNLVKGFQRKSLIEEDYLEETLGFL